MKSLPLSTSALQPTSRNLKDAEMLPFLSFPTELRLRVYAFYLQKAVIRIPGPPLSNTIALLLTCRTVYQEASPCVISTATFSLRSTKDLIYFLGSLSEQNLRALRHVIVCGDFYGIVMPGTDSPMMHTFPGVLHCFPGIQLDTLTVRDGTYGPQFDEAVFFNFAVVKGLVSRGTGWKELRYFSPNKAPLNCMQDDQPKGWDEKLKNRDGETSGAGVRILVGKRLVPYTPDDPGGLSGFYMKDTTASPRSRQSHDEAAPWREEDYNEYNHGAVVPRSLAAYEQRPVVVVMLRGDRAIDGEDVPRWFSQMLKNSSWKEIREENRIQRFTYQGNRR